MSGFDIRGAPFEVKIEPPPRIARNCAHWDKGICQRCGVQWQGCEVHGDFACPHFEPRLDGRD